MCVKFSKECPICSCEMNYSNKESLVSSIKNNTSCNSCSRLKNNPEWAVGHDVVIDDLTKTYSKFCSECGNAIYYTRKDTLKDSIVKNRLCRSCSKKGKVPPFFVDGKIPDTILLKISKSWFKKGDRPVNADDRKGKTLEEIYGKEKSDTLRIKYSSWERTEKGNIKRKNTMIRRWEEGDFDNVNRTVSEETKLKHRLNMVMRLKRIDKNFHPPYNEKACIYFNYLMEKTNTKIRHALNGGELHIKELGYWVDGYDKENNIVYEFDEKRHFNRNGTLKEKDIQRQKLITEHLKCKFVRIKWSDII